MSYPNYTNGNRTQNQGEPIGLDQQRKLAYALQQQSDQPQGQMISGHYVAPSWTQQLAQAIKAPVGAYLNNDADKKQADYDMTRRQKMAELIKANNPQQIAGAPTVTSQIPAYEPNQMDRFGSPMPDAVRQPVVTETPNMVQETPEQQRARVEPLMMDYMSQYKDDPNVNYMISRMDRTQDRTEKLADVNSGHEYDTGVRKELRGNQVEDRNANQEFTHNEGTLNREQQTAMQQAGFSHAEIMQTSQQGFQAKMQANQQGFAAGQTTRQMNNSNEQARLGRESTLSNQAPIAVLGQDGKPTYVNRGDAIGKSPYSAAQEAKDTVKVQQKAQSEISTQQVLDQANALYSHPGRVSATGASSFMSKIPGTDAKGFQANLDTFKAQTFIPMVSALKGMGALSDAEGRKLSESVGALDPSMPEAEFAKSLQDVTKTLYAKAKANGLNVSLPDFAQQRAGDKAKPSKVLSEADRILGL